MIKKIESRELSEDEKIRVQNEIGMAKQKCWMAGNNDSEIDLLNEILDDYLSGDLQADLAIEKANHIFESKNLR